jgi:nicotinate-nucleotide adenylyltransferase
MKKIGIYGGAFNPVHYGHLRTAEEVYEKFSLTKVLFIPSGRTPFDKPDLAKAHHRLEMIKRALKGNRHFSVSDIETKSRGKSYTIDTVRKLKKLYPDSEFSFILGIDAFLDLPYWKQPDGLMDLASFIVLSRPGYAFCDLQTSPYLKGVSTSKLKKLDSRRDSELIVDTSSGSKVFLHNVTGLTISASGIRDRIRDGVSIKYLLPDSVKSYIISNTLYT